MEILKIVLPFACALYVVAANNGNLKYNQNDHRNYQNNHRVIQREARNYPTDVKNYQSDNRNHQHQEDLRSQHVDKRSHHAERNYQGDNINDRGVYRAHQNEHRRQPDNQNNYRNNEQDARSYAGLQANYQIEPRTPAHNQQQQTHGLVKFDYNQQVAQANDKLLAYRAKNLGDKLYYLNLSGSRNDNVSREQYAESRYHSNQEPARKIALQSFRNIGYNPDNYNGHKSPAPVIEPRTLGQANYGNSGNFKDYASPRDLSNHFEFKSLKSFDGIKEAASAIKDFQLNAYAPNKENINSDFGDEQLGHDEEDRSEDVHGSEDHHSSGHEEHGHLGHHEHHHHDISVHTKEIPKFYHVPIYEKVKLHIPHPVPIPVPTYLKIPIPQPYPVHVKVEQPIEVPFYKVVTEIIEKKVPYTVEKKEPYTVEKPYAVHVEKKVEIKVPKPYHVPYTIYKHVLVHHSKKGSKKSTKKSNHSN